MELHTTFIFQKKKDTYNHLQNICILIWEHKSPSPVPKSLRVKDQTNND